MPTRTVEHFVGRCSFCSAPNLLKIKEVEGDIRHTYVECERCGKTIWRASGPVTPEEKKG